MCSFGVLHHSSVFGVFFVCLLKVVCFYILLFLPVDHSSFINTFQQNCIVIVTLPLFQGQYIFPNVLPIGVELLSIHKEAQYSTAAPFFPLWDSLI